MNIAPQRFLPIEIEATGRFGDQAAQFLKLVAKDSHLGHHTKRSYLHFLKKRIRANILRYNSHAKASFLLNLVEMKNQGKISEVHDAYVEETKSQR